jgi:AbrB family looped-hinge helix DNA binding protein
MKITIDAAGRLVVPKRLRAEAGIEPGARLEIRLRDGRIEIEPEARAVRLEREGRLLVAVPEEMSETLGQKVVEQTLREIRGRHADR